MLKWANSPKGSCFCNPFNSSLPGVKKYYCAVPIIVEGTVLCKYIQFSPDEHYLLKCAIQNVFFSQTKSLANIIFYNIRPTKKVIGFSYELWILWEIKK